MEANIITAAAQYSVPLLIGIVGTLMVMIKSGQDKAMEALKEAEKEHGKRFEDLRAELPTKYVLREDFLRAISNMENKMEKGFDDLGKKIDTLMVKGGKE